MPYVSPATLERNRAVRGTLRRQRVRWWGPRALIALGLVFAALVATGAADLYPPARASPPQEWNNFRLVRMVGCSRGLLHEGCAGIAIVALLAASLFAFLWLATRQPHARAELFTMPGPRA